MLLLSVDHHYFLVRLFLAGNCELNLCADVGIELCIYRERAKGLDGLGDGDLSLVYLDAVSALELIGNVLVGNRAVELGVSTCGILENERDVSKFFCDSLSLCFFGVYLVLL